MKRNTAKKFLSKKEWDKEDILQWLHAHLGEYITTRARIHSEIYENLNKFHSEHLEELDAIGRAGTGSPLIWAYETGCAIGEILPAGKVRPETLTISDWHQIATEVEPEVQRIISAITALKDSK